MTNLKMIPRAVFILAIFCWVGSGVAQEPSAQAVDRAINKTIEYFFQNQDKQGGWREEESIYPRGVSCLVTLALLNAGQDPSSPAMARALRHIADADLDTTYTVSLQTMALCAADPNKYAAKIRKNVEQLLVWQTAEGSWHYGKRQGAPDPSNSQFALLALHEAQRVGVDISKQKLRDSFQRSREYWFRIQNRDGSFGYNTTTGTGSMTCAGISSLIIIGSQIEGASVNEIECCGRDDETRLRVSKALEWMGRNFDVRINPGSGTTWYYYYMYGLERAGRLAGRRFFVDAQQNNLDWYRAGVRYLIASQDSGGSFKSPDTGAGAYGSAAMALLFLAKGKRQVVVNRLEFGNDADWNHHPMSVQHLTAYIEQAWKRDLTWQTVRLRQAKVEDLLEAPVLFISGSNTPNFTQPEKLLLKRFVEQGGFIFAEGCAGNGCRDNGFEDYFKRLMVELFDQPLEKLAPDHPIWSAEGIVDPKDLPEGSWLYGVQSCCRLAVVYCPYSLSCRWELNLPYGNRPDYSAKVQSDLDTATKIGVNVISYATGKELKQKLDTVSILEEVVQRTPTDRGLFLLPVVQHNAGADEAPRATVTLIEWLNQENPFQMSSEKRLIPIEKSSMEPYLVVYMHGRGKLELTEAQRESLRVHFQNGGVLIGDAICGDKQFAESFEAEMANVLGSPLKPLDNARHPLFTEKFGGFKISELSVIEPAEGENKGRGQIYRRQPLIEAGYNTDGRICVLFSPLDISCALESKHSMKCLGYVREDAARLGINMVLFGLQQ